MLSFGGTDRSTLIDPEAKVMVGDCLFAFGLTQHCKMIEPKPDLEVGEMYRIGAKVEAIIWTF